VNLCQKKKGCPKRREYIIVKRRALDPLENPGWIKEKERKKTIIG